MMRLVCFRFEPTEGYRTIQVREGTRFLSATHYNGAPGVFALVPETPGAQAAPLFQARIFMAELGKPTKDPAAAGIRPHHLGISAEPSGTAFAVFFLEVEGEAVGTRVGPARYGAPVKR